MKEVVESETKTVTVEKTKYVACDGMEFTNRVDCLRHEIKSKANEYWTKFSVIKLVPEIKGIYQDLEEILVRYNEKYDAEFREFLKYFKVVTIYGNARYLRDIRKKDLDDFEATIDNYKFVDDEYYKVIINDIRNEDDCDTFGIVIENSEMHRKRILDMIKEYEELFDKKFEL